MPIPWRVPLAVVLCGLASVATSHGATHADATASTPAVSGTPGSCGDGLLAQDETCESCPADCQPSSCNATGRRKVTIELAPQQGYTKVGAVVLLLSYRKGVLGLPGEKNAPAAQARATARQPTELIVVNDLGYALRAVVSSKEGLVAGPLLDVDLDACAGAPGAQAGDLSCRVESCAQGGARLQSCECSVQLP